MFIYLITNTVNGKMYIGQTIHSVELRWKRHCWNVTVTNSNMPISYAIKKYGKENFTIEPLLKCKNLDELNYYEKLFVNVLNTWSPIGYNLKAGNGKGAMSKKTKEKIANSNKGRIVSLETKRKASLSHLGNTHSQETKKKMSDFMKGKKLSALAKENSIKATAKHFTMRSPKGEIINICNMAKFCREFKLSASKMCNVLAGKASHHKGWKII